MNWRLKYIRVSRKKFKLRLLAWRKLRLSAVVFCVLGCFFGLAFEGVCGLRLSLCRVATFHVDSMLAALSVLGGLGFGVGFHVDCTYI
jgi:hypothetical protein